MILLYVVVAYTLVSLVVVRAEAGMYRELGLQPLHIHIGQYGPTKMFHTKLSPYPLVVAIVPVGAQLCHAAHDEDMLTIERRMWVVGVRSVSALCLGFIGYAAACMINLLLQGGPLFNDLLSATVALGLATAAWIARRELSVYALIPLGFTLPLAVCALLLFPVAPDGIVSDGSVGSTLFAITSYWIAGCQLLLMYGCMPLVFFDGGRLLDLYLYRRHGEAAFSMARRLRGWYTVATVCMFVGVILAIG